jgi:branched-chain amino acid transport system substrate-binding protein
MDMPKLARSTIRSFNQPMAFATMLLGIVAASGAAPAQVQLSDGAVKIGVINDQTGVYADLGGPGSAEAARMAIEDAGGKVLGKPVELLVADHLNKADVGAGIARRWFDVDKVGMVIGFDNSSVALAVQRLADEHNRIAIAGAVATTDFTGKACTATSASWIYDSYALTTDLVRPLVAQGLDSWFFITVDYTFGHLLEADASAAIIAAGGKVVGKVRHPLSTQDFSSYLLQAQSSGAKVVAFANGGQDMTHATKEANEFGLTRGGQRLASLLVFISDIHSIGLEAAQGLTLITAFYWDRDAETRAWSQRFFARRKTMPTMVHAAVYSAVRHYLASIEAAGTDEAKAVMAKMREMPVNDIFARNGRLREDGRLVHDLYLMQVKKPAESTAPWDYYKVLSVIPGKEAFRSLEDGGCPMVKH